MDALRTINITFNNAKRQADRLNECASQLQKIQRQIDSLSGNLQRDWSGDAANAFLAKCNASDINQISSTIRSAANVFYAAEMKALEIANSRG